MRLKFNLSLLVMSFFLVTSSCKKEGCTDSDAENYNKEAKKDDGTCVHFENNANVETISIAPDSWLGDGNGYYAEANSSIINSQIVQSGAVLCYWIIDDAATQLPISKWEVSGWTTHIFYTYELNSIYIEFQDDDGFTPNPGSTYGETNFRIVTISSKGLDENPNVDLNNYEEVKEVFKI